MHQVFICDTKAIEAKIKVLKKSSISDGGWSEHFIDPSNNEKWLLSYYNAEYHGGGVPVLKRLPIPETNELIEIAMTSENEDEIRCASLELVDQETINKKDFRIDLLNRLQNFKTKSLSVFDRKRIKLIITESQLTNSISRRNSIHKSHDEVLSDANHLKDIAAEAKNILSL